MSGAASEVRHVEEQSSNPNLTTVAATVLAIVGIAERGEIGSSVRCASFTEWQKKFGGYTANNLDVVAAVKGHYDNAGDGAVVEFVRVVHCTTPGDPTTKASAKATFDLNTALAAASAGYIESANAQPFALAHGDTLVCKIDAGGELTGTIAATAAARETTASETFALVNGQNITVKIDRGATQTIAFLTSEFVDIGAATAEEVAAVISAKITGARVSVTSGGAKVTITSDTKGTGSHVEVTGGTAAALNFAAAEVNGTGNVANVAAVTAAEIKAILDAIPFVPGATVSTPGGKVRITSNTTGADSKVQVVASSTADDEIGFDNAVHSGSSGAAVGTLRATGKSDGTYAHGVTMQVAAASSGDATRFNFYVLVGGAVKERFVNASMDATDDRYIITLVNDTNNGSDYITLADLAASPVDYPAIGTFGPLAGGNDGLAALADADYTGGTTANGSTGLRCFDAVDIDLLIVPGRATSAVHNAMITYCEVTKAGLVFPILDIPAGYSAQQAADYVETTASLYRLSEFGAIYWPRVKIANPSKAIYGNADTVVVAPSGHIAGVYVRNDVRKVGGTFEQPAGFDAGIGVPRNVLGFETDEVLKKSARDIVCAKNINPISRERGTPIFIDGTATLKDNGNWPSVGQRRGVIFVEKTMVTGLAIFRHRNLNASLYEREANTAEEFLLELTRNGAFKSAKPSEAFFVDFGAGLNNSITQRARTSYGRIGLATSEPNTFIVLMFTPDTRALQAELAALMAA